MEQWQDAASQQLQLLTERLNELLSRGLGLLRSELGVDLGVKAGLVPPWVTAVSGGAALLLLLLLLLLLGASVSVCRAVFKKRGAERLQDDDGGEIKRSVSKPVKTEEPKKKKKKKAQSNGRAVPEPQEEAIVSEELVPHHQPPPSGLKADKIPEGKKSKKKAKQAPKETKPAAVDGKEPEEGTWETKVSNKEKREQRKKDKSSSDGSASPGGGDTPVSTPSEQPKTSAAAPPPANQKKKKGESAKVKAEKAEAVVPQVANSKVTPVPACLTEVPIKVPAQNVPGKLETWKANREAESLWAGDIDESWTVIEAGMPTTGRKLASLAGLNAEPMRDLTWLSQHRVDDEWSGLNGTGIDPSSDWNAPAEVWGNYEEPTSATPSSHQQILPEPTRVNQPTGDDDDDDKGETVADAAAKKKKKKKKKKAAEEVTAGQADGPEKEVPPVPTKKQAVQEKPTTAPPAKAATVEPKVEKPVKDNISQKPPVPQVPQKPTEVEPTAKETGVSAPTQQKKPEESQAQKPAKKKKARRET